MNNHSICTLSSGTPKVFLTGVMTDAKNNIYCIYRADYSFPLSIQLRFVLYIHKNTDLDLAFNPLFYTVKKAWLSCLIVLF
ncbi:hypothetical protein CXF72_08580 [Psychromonas sp. MB-3u-54]|nr:hypothetical protein CXF72_08580 [Psychromonas sp. MB-3u-54]